MKLFIGLTDIASQIGDFRTGFQELGIETYVGVHAVHSKTIDGTYDFNIDEGIDPDLRQSRSLIGRVKRKVRRVVDTSLAFSKAARECDVFLFMWSSFYESRKDFAILKRRGKRIVTAFVGDDVRWRVAMEQEFDNFGLPKPEYEQNYHRPGVSLEHRLNYLRTAERYSDVILSQPNQAQLALRPYHHFYVPLDLSKYEEDSHQRESNPIVIHAPTHQGYKGTRYVLEAFQKLAAEGIAFQPRLIQNMPHSEVIREYTQADIVVEQLLSPGGGKQSREALACGAVVLTNLSRHYDQMVSPECPIVHVDPGNLYFTLKEIILDYPRRSQLARQGRPFVQNFHETKSVCQRILRLLQPDSERPDYVPSFFRDQFRPESLSSVREYNKWTTYVKDCGWYKKHVAPGERNGLIF